MLGQVDGGQVTDRDIVHVLWQADLGAEVREVNRARVVVDGTVVDRVLPGQPRVAGALEGDQDCLELLPGANLLEHVELAGFCHLDVLGVASGERSTVELVEVSNLERVEEVPGLVVLDALHELVRDPHRGVGSAGTAVGVTRVLTKVKELGEVQVPVLHVEAQRTKLLATAADGAKHRVDGVHEGDGASRAGVVRANGRSLSAQLGHSKADTAGALGQPHNIAGGLRDVLNVVLHFHDETVSELGVAGATVYQGGTCSQVLELRHLLVELESLSGGILLVQGEAHGDAHPEVLGNLEGVAVAALDAVAVVEGNDTDVLEQLIAAGLEGCSETVKVEHLDEALVEQTLVDTAGHVLSEVLGVEGLQLLSAFVVTEHALVNGLNEQTGCYDVESRVVFDVLEGDLDDGFVKLLGRDAIEQGQFELACDLSHPGDRVVQPHCCGLDCQVDLVRVVGLFCAVALDHCDCHGVVSLVLVRGDRKMCRNDGVHVSGGVLEDTFPLAARPLYMPVLTFCIPHILWACHPHLWITTGGFPQETQQFHRP